MILKKCDKIGFLGCRSRTYVVLQEYATICLHKAAAGSAGCKNRGSAADGENKFDNTLTAAVRSAAGGTIGDGQLWLVRRRGTVVLPNLP